MSALTKKQVAQAILISPVVNMEKINCGYDDVGERNRRRTAHQKGNSYGIWRKKII